MRINSNGITNINVKVDCPRTPYYYIEEVHVRAIMHHDGKPIACTNGCNSFDGSEHRLKCCGKIQSIFSKENDYREGDVVSMLDIKKVD